MYKTLLSDYDTRQRELVLENAELRKVLQQMKKDMVSILSSRKQTLKGDKHEDCCIQVRQQVFLNHSLDYCTREVLIIIIIVVFFVY